MWWDPHPILQSIRGDHNLQQPSFLSSTTQYHHQLFCDDYTDSKPCSVHYSNYPLKILSHSSLSVLQDLLAVRLSQHCSGAVAMSKSLVWSVEKTELAFSKSSLVSRLLLVISMIPTSWRKLQPKLMVSWVFHLLPNSPEIYELPNSCDKCSKCWSSERRTSPRRWAGGTI